LPKSIIDTPDCYVVFNYHGKEYKTKVVNDDRNPVFN